MGTQSYIPSVSLHLPPNRIARLTLGILMQALLRSVMAGTGSEAGLGGLDVASTRRLVAVRLEEARTPGEVALVAGVAWDVLCPASTAAALASLVRLCAPRLKNFMGFARVWVLHLV